MKKKPVLKYDFRVIELANNWEMIFCIAKFVAEGWAPLPIFLEFSLKPAQTFFNLM